MKKLLFVLAVLFACNATYAQQSTKEDEEAIIDVIKTLFDAYRAQDSTTARALFHPDAMMNRAVTNKEGHGELRPFSVDAWMNFMGTKSDNYYDERIYSYDVTMDIPLATVWTEFSFFLNGNLSHCGYNVFQLIKTADGWKITNVIDTGRKTGCKTD